MLEKMLKLHDLIQQGVTLSKEDAMQMHSTINEISQRGGDKEILFPGTGEDAAPKEDPLKAYYAEIRQRNSDLLKENFDLKKENDALKSTSIIKIDNPSPNIGDINLPISTINAEKPKIVKAAKVKAPKSKPSKA